MCMVLVVDQAALYTRTSPVTYAKGNSSSYLKDILIEKCNLNFRGILRNAVFSS